MNLRHHRLIRSAAAILTVATLVATLVGQSSAGPRLAPDPVGVTFYQNMALSEPFYQYAPEVLRRSSASGMSSSYGNYWMYYCNGGGGDTIGFAHSDDAWNFVEDAHSIISWPGENKCDPSPVVPPNQPDVYVYNSFAGYDGEPNVFPERIELWKCPKANPTSCSPSGWVTINGLPISQANATQPSVIFDGGTFKMWFYTQGADNVSPQDNHKNAALLGCVHNGRTYDGGVLYAESTDGLHFTLKSDPSGDAQNLACPVLERADEIGVFGPLPQGGYSSANDYNMAVSVRKQNGLYYAVSCMAALDTDAISEIGAGRRCYFWSSTDPEHLNFLGSSPLLNRYTHNAGWLREATGVGNPDGGAFHYYAGAGPTCTAPCPSTQDPNTWDIAHFSKDGDHLPVGALDDVRMAPGGFRAIGWTVDEDTTTSIDAAVYHSVNGGSMTGTSVAADVDRPDLASSAYAGYGTHHGFDTTLPSAPGTVQVCVAGAASGQPAGWLTPCKTITYSNTPIGGVDQRYAVANGIRVVGWTIDPDVAASNNVVVYVTGTAGPVPTQLGAAADPRPDIGALYPEYGPTGPHEFSGVATTAGAGSGPYSVCVWFINYSGTPGNNKLDSCASV